jgi:hypothetical protein
LHPPCADISDQIVLHREHCTDLGGWAGPNCTVSAVAMMLLGDQGDWMGGGGVIFDLDWNVIRFVIRWVKSECGQERWVMASLYTTASQSLLRCLTSYMGRSKRQSSCMMKSAAESICFNLRPYSLDIDLRGATALLRGSFHPTKARLLNQLTLEGGRRKVEGGMTSLRLVCSRAGKVQGARCKVQGQLEVPARSERK